MVLNKKRHLSVSPSQGRWGRNKENQEPQQPGYYVKLVALNPVTIRSDFSKEKFTKFICCTPPVERYVYFL